MGTIFNKFEFYDESTKDESLICKFCQERFPENVLAHRNRLRKLKRHLLTKHEDKLTSTLQEFLSKQMEKELKANQEYKHRTRGKKETDFEVFDKFEHFDQS